MPENLDYKIIRLPFKSKADILACGAELKNTFCLVHGNKMLVSANNGDLENPDNFQRYEKRIGAALRRFKIRPRLVCADMHPEYLSTKFAGGFSRKNNLPLKLIQHHHAHLAGCMLENCQNGRAIGVAFDGTGLGSDGKLWGAEFLIFDYKNFQRQAHLKYIPLAGGNKAILEPWRLAALWLYLLRKDGFLKLKIDFVKKLDKKKWRVIKQMIDKQINSPLSSSMGRLFDAVSSLIGIRNVVEYEAQSAIELERMAGKLYPQEIPAYRFNLRKKEGWIIEPEAIFSGIVKDLINKENPEKIALRFHYTIAEIIKETCLLIAKKEKLDRVFLSGGVFQNKILTRKTEELLRSAGFKVFKHIISANDSGISIGQAAIGLSGNGRGKLICA